MKGLNVYCLVLCVMCVSSVVWADDVDKRKKQAYIDTLAIRLAMSLDSETPRFADLNQDEVQTIFSDIVLNEETFFKLRAAIKDLRGLNRFDIELANPADFKSPLALQTNCVCAVLSKAGQRKRVILTNRLPFVVYDNSGVKFPADLAKGL